LTPRKPDNRQNALFIRVAKKLVKSGVFLSKKTNIQSDEINRYSN
jgi:hypothetical protein